MNLSIQLFAGLAERFGSHVLSFSEPRERLTVGELKLALIALHPHMQQLIEQSFIAKNQAYAEASETVNEGDELALIPPVSGGDGTSEASGLAAARERFVITHEPLSVEDVTAKVNSRDHGATLAFVGTTREYTLGQRTVLLEYEAYVPMALRTLAQIGDEIQERWPGADCAISHRLGRVNVGETSVIIAVSTPHRNDCYDASRYAIERLKQIVPIWKKEVWEDGTEWKGHQLGPWDPTTSME